MSSDATFNSSRFVLERELGSGGFGVVYQAHDRDRDQRVALKVLHRLGATALYRFKQEFRSLADIVHPNLVSLHELICDGGQWFFTMELVQGKNFLEHVVGSSSSAASASAETEEAFGRSKVPTTGDHTLPPLEPGAPEATGTTSGERAARARHHHQVDIPRLRAAMGQLIEGVSSLHAAGKLHRDIKPANVLITGEGRLVLLDFGMVADLLDDRAESKICGTPYYMAPEQSLGQRLTAGSDWYSVGVMLYEALTGSLPYEGGQLEVMVRKQKQDPVPPVEIDPSVPQELNDLCLRLLDRDPARRPSDDELLESWAPEESVSARMRAARPALTLLGREREQQLLRQAFERTQQGQLVMVHVHGLSGVGKSTLVQHFVDQLELEQAAVVRLDGRCYKQESVPYKALDGLVDSLCDHLRGLPPQRVEALLPRNLAHLACLFPVLSRVAVVSDALKGTSRMELPPQEELRRAVAALRELLARLGDGAHLVLVLDDAQWGDLDSAELLDRLLRPPDPPRLLFLVCFRREEQQGNAFVQRFRSIDTREPESVSFELSVDELDPQASRELALALLPHEDAEALAPSIARESKGNPFLIKTLVDFVVNTQVSGRSLAAVSLERALRSQLDLLPETAQRLLEVVSIAGLPISERVASRACQTGEEAQTCFRTLRTAHLLRVVAADRQDRVVPYHDRIRETVVGFIEPERRRAHHQRLAEALEEHGEGDPELLANHFEQAGDLERAASYTRQAADRARETLAFDRAALLLRRALELQPSLSREEARALQIRLADALVDAQRGAEAAPIFLEAAAEADRQEELELKRRAAEQWMKSGHIEKGRAVLQEVLAAFSIKLPPTPRRALISLLRLRARLRLRGLRFTTRDASEVAPETLAKIDLCWSGWTGLSVHDFVHAAELHCRSLLLSLEAGDPYRIARALTMEAVFLASNGEPTVERTERLLGQARELAEMIGSTHILGLVEATTGVCAYLQGRMHLIHDACVRAARLLRNLPGTYWELGLANLYAVEGLVHTGRLADLQDQLYRYVAEAESRRDLLGALGMQVQGHVAHLAADDPDLALRMVERGMAPYADQTVRLPHYWEFYALGQIHLYAGQGKLALDLVNQRLSGLKRAMLLRMQVARAGARYLRGRCAVAAAQESVPQEASRLLQIAAREAAANLREKSLMGQSKGLLVQAGVAASKNEIEAARRALARAAEGFDRLEMDLYANAARRRLGQLTGGAEGRRMIARADEWLTSQKIRDPERMTAMFVPGGFGG